MLHEIKCSTHKDWPFRTMAAVSNRDDAHSSFDTQSIEVRILPQA